MEILIALLFLAMVAVFVAQDAARRGMSPIGWGLAVFCFGVVGLGLYALLRKPLPE